MGQIQAPDKAVIGDHEGGCLGIKPAKTEN